MPQADGSVWVQVNMDTTQAEKDLARLKRKIADTEKNVEDTQKKRDAAHQKEIFSAAELDAEKMKLEEIKSRLQDIRILSKDKSIGAADRDRYAAMLPGVKEELSDQQARVRLLQAEYNKVAGTVERYDSKLKEARSKLDTMKQDAGQLAQQINNTSKISGKMVAYMEKADKAMGRFGRRMKSVVAGALVFNIVSAGMRKLVEWGGKVIKTNDKAQAAIAKLKGALLTLAQPLVEVLIPAFTSFVEILAEAAAAAAALVSKLFGTTAEQSAEAAKNLNAEIEALEGTGKAAKKAGNSIASFDELNQIGGGNDQGTSGGIAPDFSGALASMEAQILTSMALVAIGALLTFTGHVLLGIGMVALGAYGLFTAAQEDPETVKAMLSGWLGEALVIAGLVAVVLGIFLAFTGHVLLGIGLIAFGAAAIFTEAKLAPEALKKMLQGPIGEIITAVSTALLALGAILAFSGVNIPLGIVLMAAGAVGIASAVAANWGAIKKALQGPIGDVLAAVSTVLLVLGVILLFSGAGIPLGLGLIAAGAVGLAAAIAPNWNAILDGLKSVWKKITGWWNSVVAPAFRSIGGFFADYIINPMLTNWEKFFNFFIRGINFLIDKLNSVSIDVPDWVPGIGGSKFGFNLKRVTEISLPRLAQGAVIPPNREFMAERHGTNVEAPLATIEEAVARVTGDQSERVVAALYTLIEIVEQKDLNVQIGDDEIGRANARYKQTRGVQVNSGAFANAY